jgi:hypothetical protein
MAKRKFIRMVTPNISKTMIEYTLILSILNRICKMTTKPLEYPRDPTLLEPLKNSLEIKTWGIEWKLFFDKTTEWATWQWANVKINKESFTLFKKKIKHTKGGYGRLPLSNVYTCHGILLRTRKFKKTNTKRFIHKFIVGFINRGLGFPWQPLINRNYETQ